MKKLFWVSILFIFILSCKTTRESIDLSVEYFNVGNAYLELNKLDKAESYYLKSIDIDADYNSPRFNLSKIYITQSKFELAKEQLYVLYEKDNQNIKINSMLGFCFYVEGDIEKSLEYYIAAYDMGDISKETHLNIAKLYYQLDRYDDAKTFISNLLSLGDDPTVIYIGGIIYEKSGDLKEALRLYLLSMDLGLDSTDLYLKILDIYILNADYAGQKNILSLLIDKVDDKAGYTFSLGYIYIINDNNFSKGYDLIKKAIDLGFNSVSDAESLLNEPNLIEMDKIRQLFVDNGII